MRRWLAIVLALAGIAAVTWFAAEQHYENCIEAAKAGGAESEAEAILEDEKMVAELSRAARACPGRQSRRAAATLG